MLFQRNTSVILRHFLRVRIGKLDEFMSKIGENAIINTQSSVDHDCCIGAHTHLSPGVTLSGGVHIGACSHVGTGANVIQNVLIGRTCLVGAGSLVIHNVQDEQCVVGVPAKPFSS